MKKLFAGSMFFALAGASLAFTANHNMYLGSSSTHIVNTGCQVVALSELTQDMIEDFFTGKTPQSILECPSGSVLPFNLSLKGEFLALEVEDTYSNIKILKTCFIKRLEDTFVFSTDLQHWKDFQEFFTGRVGVSLNIEEGTPSVGFNIELNQRS
ncbi:hypothetical protein PHSC3_001838 [Chlamydiales bacterium STE3]|nr:hypothetical protein PHSC3_001838 [Chlamydiales bacterium STE3]